MLDCDVSDFSKKTLSGLVPTDEDWTQHLIESHRVAPSMTPAAFAGYRTVQGLNSYQMLADVLNSMHKADLRILDLACGDGHLVHNCLEKLGPRGEYLGIDMVDSEIIRANSQFSDSRVKCLCAQAQQIPVESGSIDVVLCHLALMLMLPVEPVIREISRVLVKGGKFAAVVGGPRANGSIASEAAQVMGAFVKAKYPAFSGARFGDHRVQSLEGLKTLFDAETGFSGIIDIQDFDIVVQSRTKEDLWNFFKDMYLVGMLPNQARIELKTRLLEFFEGYRANDGCLSFSYPLRKFEVHKLE